MSGETPNRDQRDGELDVDHKPDLNLSPSDSEPEDFVEPSAEDYTEPGVPVKHLFPGPPEPIEDIEGGDEDDELESEISKLKLPDPDEGGLYVAEDESQEKEPTITNLERVKKLFEEAENDPNTSAREMNLIAKFVRSFEDMASDKDTKKEKKQKTGRRTLKNTIRGGKKRAPKRRK